MPECNGYVTPTLPNKANNLESPYAQNKPFMKNMSQKQRLLQKDKLVKKMQKCLDELNAIGYLITDVASTIGVFDCSGEGWIETGDAIVNRNFHRSYHTKTNSVKSKQA